MNKTEIIGQIEEIYNLAAERQDVVLESALHDLLMDISATETDQIYPKLDRIHSYEVLNQWLIVGSYNTVCLALSVNDGQPAWLTCEAAGGACVLWYEDPSDSYEDRMSAIWNMTEQNIDEGRSGYITEPAGAYDQWIFPVDNITDDEGVGRTAAENELYIFAANLAEMLC